MSLSFQIWILIGANLTSKQQAKRSLPTSIDGCSVTILESVLFNTTNIMKTNTE